MYLLACYDFFVTNCCDAWASEYKNLTTDRVVLGPGTKSEVACVRAIFQLALQKKISEVDLNSRRVPYVDGQPWTYSDVYRVVTSPKYAGCNVWGRTTQKLRSKRRPTTPDQWAIKRGAFKAVVDQELFDRVIPWIALRLALQTFLRSPRLPRCRPQVAPVDYLKEERER